METVKKIIFTAITFIFAYLAGVGTYYTVRDLITRENSDTWKDVAIESLKTAEESAATTEKYEELYKKQMKLIDSIAPLINPKEKVIIKYLYRNETFHNYAVSAIDSVKFYIADSLLRHSGYR